MPSELINTKSQTSCWVCGSCHTVPWRTRTVHRELTPEDFRITDSHYGTTLALRRCLDCDFIFSESEEVALLTRLYEQMADQEYEKSQDTRLLQMRWLISVARDFQPAARSLLDIGAGSGLLVREAGCQGLEAIGVEPSRALVELARSQNKVDVRLGTFPQPQLAGRRFDLVFLVDVIEHVNNPLELLRHCAEALNDRGVLVLVTPDVFSLTARIVGKRWWHFRPAHVGYFSPKSLAAICRAAGLRALKRFRAKWFFRVYYLAERLAEYLPLEGVNRLAAQIKPLQWLYQRTVAVNLHDSTVLILGKSGRAEFQISQPVGACRNRDGPWISQNHPDKKKGRLKLILHDRFKALSSHFSSGTAKIRTSSGSSATAVPLCSNGSKLRFQTRSLRMGRARVIAPV